MEQTAKPRIAQPGARESSDRGEPGKEKDDRGRGTFSGEKKCSSLERRKKSILTTNQMVKVAILGAISFVVMLIDFPVAFAPGFLKMDFSDVPAIIGGFALGPIAGVLIELIKNLLHLMKTNTGGVGELGNFLVGSSYVLTCSILYRRHHTRQGAILGALAATVVMTVIGALVNYFILLPFFAKVFPMEAIIKMGSAITPLIHDKFTLVLFGVSPFNFIKGLILIAITLVLYKHVSPLLKREARRSVQK